MALLYKLLVMQILTNFVLRYFPFLTVPMDSVQDDLEQFCQGLHKNRIFVFIVYIILQVVRN
jgi:hypothetical protein